MNVEVKETVDPDDIPEIESIRLRRQSRVLTVGFADGAEFDLGFEYLRVFSPSAEVRGHGNGEPMLVLGKEDVTVDKVEPVGNYAVRLTFDDGHNTGLYTWGELYTLGRDYKANWQRYHERLAKRRDRIAESGTR